MTSEASVPLFPLPNVILYPGAMLPLHIFEPRYVQMIDDLLEQKQETLALALLKPGWDAKYFGQPDVFPIAGIGRMVSCQRMPNHRYNILVEGMARVKLDEQPLEKSYRCTQYQRLDEIEVGDAKAAAALRQELIRGLSALAEDSVQPDPSRSISYLCDVVLVAAGADITEKQRIFAILDVAERGREVLQMLNEAEQLSRRTFGNGGRRPQDPSLN
jgi:uncharacterized protein